MLLDTLDNLLNRLGMEQFTQQGRIEKRLMELFEKGDYSTLQQMKDVSGIIIDANILADKYIAAVKKADTTTMKKLSELIEGEIKVSDDVIQEGWLHIVSNPQLPYEYERMTGTKPTKETMSKGIEIGLRNSKIVPGGWINNINYPFELEEGVVQDIYSSLLAEERIVGLGWAMQFTGITPDFSRGDCDSVYEACLEKSHEIGVLINNLPHEPSHAIQIDLLRDYMRRENPSIYGAERMKEALGTLPTLNYDEIQEGLYKLMLGHSIDKIKEWEKVLEVEVSEETAQRAFDTFIEHERTRLAGSIRRAFLPNPNTDKLNALYEKRLKTGYVDRVREVELNVGIGPNFKPNSPAVLSTFKYLAGKTYSTREDINYLSQVSNTPIPVSIQAKMLAK